MTLISPFERVTRPSCALVIGSLDPPRPATRGPFRNAYSGLDVRRQQLVGHGHRCIHDDGLTDQAGGRLGDALALVDQVAQGERQLAYHPLRH